jgi:hypothetical protein
MDVMWLILSDLTELEPAENLTDVTLCWECGPSIENWESGPSIENVLPIIKRWRHLKRLALIDNVTNNKIFVLSMEVVGDFIMEMKHLTHFHIVPDYDRSNYGQLKILREKVNEFILPRRPNFKFDISPLLD